MSTSNSFPMSQCFHTLLTHSTTANHSLSVMENLRWVGVSFLLYAVTVFHSPPPSCCSKIAPKPTSLASVAILVG